MIGRVVTIAEREFRVYVETASFWVALLLAPVLMIAAAAAPLALARSGAVEPQAPAAVTVSVAAEADPALRRAVERAALAAEGAFAVQAPGSLADLTVRPAEAGAVVAGGAEADRFSALLTEELRTDARARALAEAGVDPALAESAAAARPSAVVERTPAPGGIEGPRLKPGLVLAVLLWMVLVGALGMLMQSVVRERANKSLDALMAAARPAEIAAGKLAGVGAVSLVVLVAWLAGCAVAAALAGAGGGSGATAQLAGALQPLARPGPLLIAAVAFVLSFLTYGAVIVVLGAAARDFPAANNLSRPVFGVLLVVFFVVLAFGTGAQAPDWALFAPPLTPFVMMLEAPEKPGVWRHLGAIALLLSTSVAILAASPRFFFAKSN